MKLNKDIYFTNLKGYKLADGHFELGSNLHINHYYYAKRLFYNSFYTNRFAFLICKYILTEFSDVIQAAIETGGTNMRSGRITLLGYENYSELLVSNVRKMLNDVVKERFKLKNELFNHDIYTKDALFLKNPEKISQHIVMIFPISTTFSTSVKVRGEISEILLKDFNKDVTFHSPVINCLVIANDLLENDRKFAKGDIERTFGWRQTDISERKIEIEHLDKDYVEGKALPHLIQQKYLISLQTDWSKINNCGSCYPAYSEEKNAYAQEKNLIETKASSITPNLVFGYPKTFTYSDEKNLFSYFNLKKIAGKLEPMVYRKHFKRYGKHYIYFIRAGRFLTENNREIRDWLAKECNELHKMKDTNVVIITPTLGSNSGFANLVNDVIFSDTATIIQYNPKEEFIQNFKLFYCEILQNANSVVYIDDVLATTRSVNEINSFVKAARNYSAGIDYCVTIVNRVGYYNQQKLDEEFSRPHDRADTTRTLSFIQTYVVPIDHRDKYPFLSLMEKFVELSDKSVLDGMRVHFKERERYFKPIDLNKEHGNLKLAGSERSLLQFLVEHEFMKLFSIEKNGTEEKYSNQSAILSVFGDSDNPSATRQALMDHFLHPVQNNSIPSFLEIYPQFKAELRNTAYKVCSIEPYIRYQGIKSAAFSWVLSDLIQIIDGINDDGLVSADFFSTIKDGRASNYSPFENFKFLLKRAAKLKINYLYSIDALMSIKIVLEGIEEQRQIIRFGEKGSGLLLEEDLVPELKVIGSDKVFPIQFITYYVGLLQELIIEHESKALQVVVNIKKIIDLSVKDGKYGRTLKNSYNNHFIHLLRLLVLENTFIFHTSSDKLLAKLTLPVDFCSSEEDSEKFMSKVGDYLQTYPFLYSKFMLSRFEYDHKGTEYKDENAVFTSFKYMMLLKAILKGDLKSNPNQQEMLIQEKIRKLLAIGAKVLELKDGGAFMALKYKNRDLPAQHDDIAIVGEYWHNPANRLKPEYFSAESFLYKMFDGIAETEDGTPVSTFELTFDNLGSLHFRRNAKLNYEDCLHFSEFQDALFGRIFYIRITQIEANENSEKVDVIPQAVLCFYDKLLSSEQRDAFLALFSKAKDIKSGQESLNLERTGQDRAEYERFDPKKVRQLLLLRNDFSDFINHHLNNDSLRAFIEMINSNKYSLSLSHGTSIYQRSISNYIEYYKDATDSETQKNDFSILEMMFTFLSNKVKLIAFANKNHKQQVYDFSKDSVEYTIADLVKEFEANYLKIFTMKENQINRVRVSDNVILDISQVNGKILRAKFILFEEIFKELIFELLYNIKKHTIHEHFDLINSGKEKLHVTLSVTNREGSAYFCISNNLCYKEPSYFTILSNRLTRKRDIDGLNLLYNLIFRGYGKELFLEGDGENVTVFIPLKLT